MSEKRSVAATQRKAAMENALYSLVKAIKALEDGPPQEVSAHLGLAQSEVEIAREWDSAYLTTRDISPDVEARLQRLDELTD